MKEIFKSFNPLKIIITLIIGVIVFTIPGFVFLALTTPGGDQKPLTFLAEMIPITVYIVLVASIFTIPFYMSWIKKWWFINFFLLIICTAFIIIDWKESKRMNSLYNEINEQIRVNGIILTKRTEYYGPGLNKTRSISYTTLDDKKDSIWTTYDKNGTIIEQEVYKKDRLIKKIK